MKLFLFALVWFLISFEPCLSGYITIPLTANPISQQEYKLNNKLKGRLLDDSTTSYDQETLTYFDSVYSGNLQIGTNSQVLTIYFSTVFNDIWVPFTYLVVQNEEFVFHLDGFQCYQNNGCITTNQRQQINFSNEDWVQGIIVSAMISICGVPNKAQTLLLVDTTSYEETKGQFGLSFQNPAIPPIGGVSYLFGLKNDNLIDEAMVSFYFGYHNDSQLTIGGFNPSKLNDSSTINYHQVKYSGNPSVWGIDASYFNFGTFTYETTNIKAVQINSSSNFIGLSTDILEGFSNQLMNIFGAKDKQQFNLLCNITLPDINIYLIDSNQEVKLYSIPQSFYQVRNSGDGYDDYCYINIEEIRYPDTLNTIMILGTPFIRRYMSIFSYNNQTVCLSLSVSNPEDSDSDSGSGFPGWAIAIIVLASLLIIGGGFYCLLKKDEKKKMNSNQSSYSPPRYTSVPSPKVYPPSPKISPPSPPILVIQQKKQIKKQVNVIIIQEEIILD